MFKNSLKYFLLAWMTVVAVSVQSQPPFLIEKVISENKITDFNNQKLLIIDFWATWCSPCATATKQLEILQESKSNDVFIVSVSDEKNETIRDYLKRIPIRLAVLKDYLPNSMIDLFKVKSRPYSVLLTLDGKLLYKGHPAGITDHLIEKCVEKYVSQTKTTPLKEWRDLFYTVKNTGIENTVNQNDTELYITKQPLSEKRMYANNGIFYFSGSLLELIKYLTESSNLQITLDGIENYGVSMRCCEAELLNSKSAILQLVKEKLSLNIQRKTITTEAYLLDVADSKRQWNDRQINWGKEAGATYIIGTDRVEADNMSLKEIANLLSDIKESPYYYTGNDNRLHDWNFHYHYDDLMIEDLENLGIQLKKGKIDIPVYIVSHQ